jgi:hypothetical protein
MSLRDESQQPWSSAGQEEATKQGERQEESRRRSLPFLMTSLGFILELLVL